MKKIFTPEEVDVWAGELRRAGKKFGYTCGAFDLLHAGHVDYLTRARELCDTLLVAVNSDWSVGKYKDPHRPICPEAERMTVVAGLASVDAVTLLDNVRPLDQLLRWKPDLYIKGGDYQASKLRSAEAVVGYGGQAITIPVNHEVSTSQIIERVLTVSRIAEPAPVSGGPAKGIVFLDRDGTLLKETPYLSDPSQAALLPGVGEGLQELQAAGYRLVIVSNQQGIGLGYFSIRDFIAVNTALFRLISPFGVTISRIYYCPHSAAEDCDCRKPKPGMLRRALADFDMKPEQCFMIGDRELDVAAGAAAGCTAVLVGAGAAASTGRRLSTFREAAAWIVAQA